MPQTHHVLVLCPMEIERRAVAREVEAARLTTAQVLRTGVGKDAIIREFRAAAEASRPRLVILAGACGALRPVDDVPPIARVIDEHGGEWTSGVGMVESGRILIAVDRVVSTPADKRALADATGAAIVDMESHAFAAACVQLGLPWAVVRGVSDTPDETLPGEVLGWISPDGRTRNGRAVLDMIRKPSLIPHIRSVLRRSGRVLPEVGRRVVEIIRSFEDRGRTIDS
ncbi:MAG: hypothetical protein ACKVOT_13655 [Polaromonas sp.]